MVPFFSEKISIPEPSSRMMLEETFPKNEPYCVFWSISTEVTKEKAAILHEAMEGHSMIKPSFTENPRCCKAAREHHAAYLPFMITN